MPRAPPPSKPRPPPTRPTMQSVGEDDSDEESFAFVVPSRHGSPREPSPRIPVLYNVGKEKPRPPPGRPPVKKDASAAVAAANAMWDAMATDPEALAGQNAMATDPIIRGAQRDSFDDYIGARRLSDDLGDDFPADDETTANAFVVPSRSQSRSRKPAPPKKPPPKKRALPVENLSSDSDSSLSDSDDSGVGFIVPTKHKAQPSQAAIERARRASQAQRPASKEESKPSSQAVERAKAASMRAKMAHKPAPPKGPAPAMARPSAPLSVATEGQLSRTNSFRGPPPRGPRPPRGPPPRTNSSSSLVRTGSQQHLVRKDSWRDVHSSLERKDSFREPPKMPRTASSQNLVRAGSSQNLTRKGSFRAPPPGQPRPPGRPSTSDGRGPKTPSHAQIAAARWAARKGPSGAQALAAAERREPPPRGMVPPGAAPGFNQEGPRPPQNRRERAEAAPARASLQQERPRSMSPAPPSNKPDLRDARAARLAAQHAGGGNKRRKLEEDEDEDIGKRVAMRRPASSQNLFDTGDLGAPWRDPAPSLALTRKASQHNLTRAASAANVMGLEEPLLQTVARDLARQNSRQDVLKRPASTNNLALPDRVTVRKRAPPGTPSHRSPPSHPPPTNNKGKAPPGPPPGPPPGHKLHIPGRSAPAKRSAPPTPKANRPAAPSQPPGKDPIFDTGVITKRSTGRAPPPREGRPPPEKETALVVKKKPVPSLDLGSWACPLCTFRNSPQAETCATCHRARGDAEKAAEKLWAGPPAPSTTGRPPPPPKPRAAPLIDSRPEEDALATKRRLLYYRKKPPPKRPKIMRPPRAPGTQPPAHALPAGVVYKESPRRKRRRERQQRRKAHAVQSKHFTSTYNKDWEDARASRPLSLRETADRGFKTAQSALDAVPEGVVLNELRDIGGVPCGITVIQKEWRAVVHAVDLERGDEYSASSELHARYVEAAAPTPDQKVQLYRELVDACAFRSTLEGRRKAQRKLEVMPSPRLSAAQKQGGRVCVLRERLVVSGALVEVSARARSKPDVVELRLRDPASKLEAALTFPLVAAPRLAKVAYDSHVVKVRERLLATEHLDWETPWAAAAAARAGPAHPGDAVEPSRDVRATVAMAVEFACHELDMSMVDENRKTSLKLKPSPVLVAQIAEGCRHARAAVVLQKNARGMSARSPEGQAARAERLRRDASKVLQALIRMRFAKRRAAIRRESIRREIRRRERKAATSLQSVVRVAQAKCLAKMLRYLKKDAARAKKVAAIAMAKMRDRERRAAQLAIYRTARARMQIQRWSRQAIQNMRRRKREERLRRIEAARLQAEKDALERKKAAINIGRMLRGWVAQQIVTRLLWEKYELEKASSTSIQCMIRCWFARYELAVRDYERLACRAIQALVRGVLERKIIRQDRASDTLIRFWRTVDAKTTARIILEHNRKELLQRASQFANDALDADRRYADAVAAKLLTDKIQQERAMAVIKAMRCASESAVIARRRRSTCKELASNIRDAIRTRASTSIQCSIRKLLAGAETKRRRELKKALGIAAMVRRKKAEKEARENAIARKKAKRENARRALIRFQSAYRAHQARQVYLVKYVQRHACIQFQSLVRRSQAQRKVASLKAKQSDLIERKLQADAVLVFQNCLRRKLARNLLLTKRFVRDDRILAEKTAQAAKAELSRLAQEAEVQRLKDEAEQLEREIREAEENEKRKAEEEARKLRELKEEAARKAKEKEEQDRRDAMEAKLRAEAEALIQNNAARHIQRTARGRQLRVWMAWEAQQAEEARLEAEAQNDQAWREWGASIIQAWYRRLVTLQSEANERAWNYWAASIVQTWWRERLAITNIEAANAMWQRQQTQKEEQRQRMATIAQKAMARESARSQAMARKKKAAAEWNREMENQGGSRPGSAFTWADATPRETGFDTARSNFDTARSNFSPRGGLDTARSDATDVSDISDAGRFVDEFDADDKQDVEKLFRAVRHGRRDAIRQYTEKGFDVNLRNKHGHTLAMVAAQNNQKAILKQLYRFGLADHINEQDYKGNTALHYAQMYGYTQLAEYMVSKLGADETLVNRDGASAWINVEEATEVAD